VIVAIVLGAAVRPDGTASPTLRLRTDHAVALYRAGRVDRLLLTGGAGAHGPPESHVAAGIGRAAGLPDAALLTEAVSTNTVENLAEAARLLPPGATLVIVSNRWHLPRARTAARLMGLRVTVSGPLATAPWPRTLRAVLREAVAFPSTMVRAVRRRGGAG
jgi:uncharacterized SAM-binding protein YcdF (DUF218 family)